MGEEHSIGCFLQATQELLQVATTSNHKTSEFDFETWIERYERLVVQLEGAKGTEASGEARSCWKLSQDILIRLRRQRSDPKRIPLIKEQHTQNTPQDNVLLFTAKKAVDTDSLQTHVLFSGRDVDTLERRLLNICQSVGITTEISTSNKDANLGADRPTASVSQTPSRGLNQAVLQDFILESLRFRSMNYREQDIEQAHGSSFDWIFDNNNKDSHPNFQGWLSTNELGNIYWITGKPGSGKSTLIRYLSGHKKTIRALHAWAGNSDVTIAGFYFWTSGSQEQRSQTGLLRSLLHQLLSTKPDLISQALPNLWQKLASMTSKERVATTIEWSTSELMEGLLTFLDHGLLETKLCLFVDGLDEFEGDHEAIIQFFRGLAEGKHASKVKLCLSSRPWPVFERAFEYVVPNLKLQASNFQDMMRYTIDKLSANENIRSAMLTEMALARNLVQTTVEMASGVFLWVRLAVGELIRQFDHTGASISGMHTYVSNLPTELDSLFEVLVFKNQTQDNLAEISRVFQLVRAREIVADFIQDDSATSLSLWELAFAVGGVESDVAALEREVQQEPEEEILRRCVETRSWALNRSVGLLEVHHRSGRGSNRGVSDWGELVQHRVTYLHRTIRDWLILSPGNQVWHRLQTAGDMPDTNAFDPHLQLLRSYILQMKHPLEEPEHHRRLDEWYPGIALALSHARYVVHDPQGLQVRFIGEVEKTISWYWVSRGSEAADHWARHSFGTYEERYGNKLLISHPYLALCTRFGLQHYVINALDAMASQRRSEGPEEKSLDASEPESAEEGDCTQPKEAALLEETPLLFRALEFLCSRQKTIYPLSSLPFVLALLESSEKHASNAILASFIGNLNVPWSSVLLKKKNVSTWIMVLRHLRDAKRRGWIEPFDVDYSGTERWSSIVECLIQRGAADKQAVVLKDGWDPEITATGVLGRAGILDEFADLWLEERLTPLFSDV